MDDSRRCTAHLTNGSGERCRKSAIKGGNVCRSHGGAAPQTKKTARQRLLEAAEPAVKRLVQAIRSDDERNAIKASAIILDRAGFHPTRSLEVSGQNGEPIKLQNTGALAEIFDSMPIELRLQLLAALDSLPAPTDRI